MKRLLTLILVLMALQPLSARAQADPNSERVASFHTDVQVTRQNMAEINETIEYDFGGESRHGIFRYIPVDYIDDQGNKFYLAVRHPAVTDETSKPYKLKFYREGSNVIFKIGDPNYLITGPHTYKIHYDLLPLVQSQGTRDFLNLNLTGNNWDIPIDQASASLRFDDDKQLQEAKCFVGTTGSTDGAGCNLSQTGELTVGANRPLLPKEELTLTGYLPAGYVNNYLRPDVHPAIDWSEYYGLIASIVALLVALAWLVSTYLNDWRRKRGQTVIAQYESPDGLKPAELGLLIDNKGDMTEITATLIDLAVRGYIKIERTQKKAWLKKAEYSFHKLKNFGDLVGYEATLLTSMFGDKDLVSIKGIDRTKMATAIQGIQRELRSTLKDKGYLTASRGLGTWWKHLWILVLLLYIGSDLVRLLATSSGHVINFVLLGLTAAIALFAHYRSRLTNQGVEEWAEVRGFQLFLSVTETDRLKFSDAPAKTPELFNKLLPYAVALKVEKEWAAQFAGMDIMPSTGGWYAGYYAAGFTSSDLTSDLSSGFAGAIASGFAPVSSGSGSGGGGGFSGGGFGGGGGGSW